MLRSCLEKLFSLEGKKALITGGYKGIGLTIAETFAEAGADLAIGARNLSGCRSAAERIAKKYDVRTTACALDVRDSKTVDLVVRDIADEFGGLDIAVNCAGIPGSEKPVVKTTDEDINEVLDVDFRGAFFVSRAAAQIMIRQQHGKIINVSSILGKIAAKNMIGYCASKAAVIQLSRVMALELMHDNIQVNTLCPGYVLTDFNKEFFDSESGKRLVKKMIPINRVGQLDELKSTALYLATCPSYLTGTEIYIDGGHTIV